jgi:plastocyanin
MERNAMIGSIRRRRLLVTAILGAAAIGLLGRWTIVPTLEAGQGEADIAIQDFAFAPAALTVKAGTTVIWTNRDGEPHTVVEVDRRFNSPALDTDESFRHRFDQPGTFTYVCSLHPHMIGTITVSE